MKNDEIKNNSGKSTLNIATCDLVNQNLENEELIPLLLGEQYENYKVKSDKKDYQFKVEGVSNSVYEHPDLKWPIKPLLLEQIVDYFNKYTMVNNNVLLVFTNKCQLKK